MPNPPESNPSRPVTAVVLAAGESRRMGEPKLLLPWGKTTVLGQTLGNVRAAAVDDILLVSGAYAAAVEPIGIAHGVRVVHNPHYARGEILSSLKLATYHLQPRHAALVMLADLPMIGPTLLDQVTAAYRDGHGELVAPVYGGQQGHPVLIGPAYFQELRELPVDGAPRDLIRRHRSALHQVPVASDRILRDIDTPEQYERWRPQE